MTEVLLSPSHFSASSSSPTTLHRPNNNNSASSSPSFQSPSRTDEEEEEEEEETERQRTRDQEEQQLSLLALLVTLFRKSLVACKTERRGNLCSAMEIGWPTDVRHVAHVTFDRFNGFLGLPDEFEPEVPRRPPSASTTVFGVSTESMQLSYDGRGNSVPTILLMMQRHLYALGGLRSEGIFRINAENSQEEFVRNQLNGGVIPEGIEVNCLAGLIKAWFRELPNGILDSLEPEQVIQSQTEEECSALVALLPPTEAALLDWAINLMADVVQHEDLNKMNARNIAMVFAPNMTQMADPLTALMYAVQVMNFLKTLILKTLKEREDGVVEPCPARSLDPPPPPASDETASQIANTCAAEQDSEETCEMLSLRDQTNVPAVADDEEDGRTDLEKCRASGSSLKKANAKHDAAVSAMMIGQKAKGITKLSRVESRMELIEAWR